MPRQSSNRTAGSLTSRRTPIADNTACATLPRNWHDITDGGTPPWKLLGLVAAGVPVFRGRLSGLGDAAWLYVPLPFLLWAAVRFNPAALCLAILMVAVLSLSNAMSGHGPFHAESPVQNTLALQLFLLASATPLLLLSAVMGERQRATRALRSSEARYRAVVESQTELVCRYLPDTTLTFVNEAYCQYFGRDRTQLVGRSFLEFIPGSLHAAVMERVRNLTSEPAVHEHEVICADGSIGWQQWVNVAIPAPGGGPAAEYQGIGRDITDRKRAEEALRGAMDEVRTLKDQLHAENIYLQQELSDYMSMGDILCSGNLMRKVLAHAQQVAVTDTTVLLTGETGTGKELLARAIHRASHRAGRPLVRVNCAALPANLIESELFGHERGAFTGAVKRHVGRFELADRGTLFLDEIGELPLELQSKLLRVLQDGEFERLGGTETLKVDVRVIAATNRDLGDAVRHGTFRVDLFYRLRVFPIHVPPLRERTDEIPMLAFAFLEDAGRRLGRKFEGIPEVVMEALRRYSWPGNVRELHNVIERAALTTSGGRLQLPPAWEEHERPPATTADHAGAPPARMTLEALERTYITQVLEQTHWRITGPRGAAVILGLNPSTLRFRMQKLGIAKATAHPKRPSVPRRWRGCTVAAKRPGQRANPLRTRINSRRRMSVRGAFPTPASIHFHRSL